MNVTFDWNEWFFILTSAIVILLFLPIRKYFPPVLVIIIWIYNLALVATIDYFLLATPFRMYIFGDNPTYELSGALFHFFMYPCSALIFLFGYDRWELYGKKSIWYILGWSAFSIFFEWLTVKNHALIYTGWKLVYSIPVYPAAAVLLIIVFRFAKKRLMDPELEASSKIN
ncbi:hypothetical protein ABE67_00950 [Cytobacillus firmus]|uniref:hypothetical protein n=1 Tax=Cytobacillus firmus TaxID=1399 RepID=UPI0018CE5441|nr:hypothetical protein [Cytobacillus firmus]MBG9447970.1 hypothetical protein [Cytobacillus firmus]